MYNAEETIKTALDSVSEQTQLPDHIVVVDDGSNDNGAELVEQYDSPCQLTLIRQKNQGPAAARNCGISSSNEELIFFLDADDVWVKQKIEKQVALYRDLVAKGHRVGLIDCFETMHYANGKKDITADRIKKGNHFKDFINKNIINGTSCVMANREILHRFNGFDPEIRYAEDRWLWTQIAENYEIHTVPELLSHRYIDDTNITSNPSKYYTYKLKFIDKYMAKYFSLFEKKQWDKLVFISIYEFMYLFSKEGDHARVMQTFKDMISWSWSAIFYRKGRAFVRFLYALTMYYLNFKESKIN